jgi:fatty-acyl-CoA synthase
MFIPGEAFDPLAVLEAVSAERCTALHGVLKAVVARMNMREITICYGMTETSPVSAQTGPSDPLEKRVGRVHPHVEVKIVDPESGAIVPRGERGELCTRGYSVMLGYWGDDAATANAIDRGRWMHTGDLATMDEEGFADTELLAFCTGKIATYEIPRYWKIVTELPITVTGKVQKFRMREIAIAELGLTNEAAAKTA